MTDPERAHSLLVRAVAAAAAGTTGALASAPVGAHWTQWVGFVLLLRALDGLDARRAFLVGWAGGVGANVALFTWLAPAVGAYGELPGPATAVLFAVYALLTGLQYGALGLADAASRRAWARGRRLLFPLAFVTVEHLWPQLFHWTMGAAQAGSLRVAQVADLGGAVAIGYVLLAANAGIDGALEGVAAWWRGAPRRAVLRPWPEVLVGLVVAAGAFAYGGARLAQARAAMDAAPTFRVALVQPNRLWGRASPSTSAEVQAALEEGARAAGERRPDLTVFSESAAPRHHLEVLPPIGEQARALHGALLRERELGAREMARLARLARSPVLLGATHLRVRARSRSPNEAEVLARTNALVLVGADGRERARYDKHLLLPFGEYLPGEDAAPFLRSLLPTAGRFEAGPAPDVLEVDGARFGPLICYEAVDAGLVWRLCREADPDLLVNATNDVWFTWQGPWLHRMIVRLRAIETRRPLVRVTSTGLSAVVMPDGSLRAETARDEVAVEVVDVPLVSLGPPPVVRWGPLFGRAVALVWLAAVAVGLWRRRAASRTAL